MSAREVHLGRNRLQRVVPHLGELLPAQRTSANPTGTARTDAVPRFAQGDRSVQRLGTSWTFQFTDDAVVVMERDAEVGITVDDRFSLVPQQRSRRILASGGGVLLLGGRCERRRSPIGTAADRGGLLVPLQGPNRHQGGLGSAGRPLLLDGGHSGAVLPIRLKAIAVCDSFLRPAIVLAGRYAILSKKALPVGIS